MQASTYPSDERSGRTLPMAVYLLYLLGMFMVVTVPVGVAIAYWARRRAPEWLRSHYTFQLRTFWLGLPVLALGLVLAANIIGYLIIAAWAAWVIARCAVGIGRLSDARGIPEPRSLALGGAGSAEAQL
ncbi:DUF4870 family protein [Arhodomonas sp. SL1]|uniref:DUF4870 family protein n=1 Tax=Arhodomonas sp. SL1 TaxID=3425691 RepID=UPI003F88228E